MCHPPPAANPALVGARSTAAREPSLAEEGAGAAASWSEKAWTATCWVSPPPVWCHRRWFGVTAAGLVSPPPVWCHHRRSCCFLELEVASWGRGSCPSNLRWGFVPSRRPALDSSSALKEPLTPSRQQNQQLACFPWLPAPEKAGEKMAPVKGSLCLGCARTPKGSQPLPGRAAPSPLRPPKMHSAFIPALLSGLLIE